MHIHQQLAFEVFDLIRKNYSKDFKNIKVLDIGANIGQFGLALKSIIPECNIVSFEPNSYVYSQLQHNAIKFKPWATHKIGVSNRTQTDKIYFIQGRSGSASTNETRVRESLVWIRENNLKLATCKFVGPEDLKLMLPATWETIDLVKVDTEGHELKVLEGIANLEFNFLLIETNSKAVDKSQDSRATIQDVEKVLKTVTTKSFAKVAEFGGAKSQTKDYLFRRIIE